MKQIERYKCKHPGCNEWTFTQYDSVKERREGFQRRSAWKCSRHSSPEKVLSLENMQTSITLVNQECFHAGDKNQDSIGMFWNGQNGVSFGDHYKAFANDFPQGTKLILTAKIELPK